MQTRRASVARRTAAAAKDRVAVADAVGAGRQDVPTAGEGRSDNDHADASAVDGEQGGAVVARVGFAPIVRVDAERREIALCATSEADIRAKRLRDRDELPYVREADEAYIHQLRSAIRDVLAASHAEG